MTEPTITCPKYKTEIRLTESNTRPRFHSLLEFDKKSQLTVAGKRIAED